MAVNPDIAKPPVSAVDFAREETRQPLTPRQLIWRRFRKHRMALLGGIGAILLLLFIIGGSIIVPESRANETDLKSRLAPPNSEHWFGTESVGRDVFNRIIYGGQISLFIGVLAVVIAVSLGTLIGGIAAYYGGWVDAILMRFTEAMLAIPSLFLLIVLAKFIGREVGQVDVEIDKIIDSKPDDFMRFAKMDKQEVYTRAAILEAIHRNVLTKEATSVYYMGEKIATDYEDAVIWFMDPQNPKMKVAILEKLRN